MIHARELVKEYVLREKQPGKIGRRLRTVRAIDGLCMDVGKGDIVGYIGPNGAGKSTTIKILSGILYPDSGSCTVDGRIPWKNRIEHVSRIGVVFGQRTQLWWDLPPSDSFKLLADMYRVPRGRARDTVATLTRELDLGRFLETPVRQLSLGERMRCELAAALVHEPPILFLDEPSIGLDAPSKLAMRSFIRRLNAERGTTVILTTHDMDDIEALASRVMLIGRGRMLFDGSMAGLRREAGDRRRAIADLTEGSPVPEKPPHPALKLEDRSGWRLCYSFDPSQISEGEALAAIARALAVENLALEARPVEELVTELYRKHGV